MSDMSGLCMSDMNGLSLSDISGLCSGDMSGLCMSDSGLCMSVICISDMSGLCLNSMSGSDGRRRAGRAQPAAGRECAGPARLRVGGVAQRDAAGGPPCHHHLQVRLGAQLHAAALPRQQQLQQEHPRLPQGSGMQRPVLCLLTVVTCKCAIAPNLPKF